MTVVFNLNGIDEMLAARGLQEGGPVQQVLTHTLAREMDEYVPMQFGGLKNSKIVRDTEVVYPGPQAAYLYNAMLMVDPNTGSAWAKLGQPKVLTDTPLNFHGAPTRGGHWDTRCWADKKDKIVEQVAKAAGGVPGK